MILLHNMIICATGPENTTSVLAVLIFRLDKRPVVELLGVHDLLGKLAFTSADIERADSGGSAIVSVSVYEV